MRHAHEDQSSYLESREQERNSSLEQYIKIAKGETGRLSGWTVGRLHATVRKAYCSVTKRAPSRPPSAIVRDSSKRRPEELCFSTKSATFRRSPRANYCD